TSTTRLMLAMCSLLLLRTCVRFSIGGLGDGLALGLRLRWRWAGRTAFDAADGEVAHDAVGDAEDPRQLRECLRLGVEVEQVVRAFALVSDLVREPAPPPDVMADPLAAALLHQIARTLDDLLLPILRQFGIEHEQDFVCDHVSRDLPSSGLNRPRRRAQLGKTARWRGRKRRPV